LGVRVLLIQDQSVLLVKHTYQQFWYIPGGGVKKEETIEQAIRREVMEELGIQMGEIQLFGVYTNFFEYKNDHVVVFVCQDYTLPGETDAEIECFDYFSLDNLPSSISPGSKRRIDEYLSNKNTPAVSIW
jgi:8-oxo-dGTP pyrophosphatase MutT (NUDIX family)